MRIVNVSRLQERDDFGKFRSTYDIYVSSEKSFSDITSSDVSYSFFDNFLDLKNYIKEEKLGSISELCDLAALDDSLNRIEERLSKLMAVYALTTTIDEEGIFIELYDDLEANPLKESRKINQIEKFITKLEKKRS